MAKKSKEIEVGGYRVQVDPLILVRRILGRQKLLLALVAIIGGSLTIWSYVRTPKRYTSSAEIVIRAETFQDDVLRKFLNVVARYVGSDTEMMIIINELNLYDDMRATLPYDIALRAMKRELKIDRPGGSISISYQSADPREAQRVVAFVTERVLERLADLEDAPFRQQLIAIESGLGESRSRLKEATEQLFEFRAKYPDIATTSPYLSTPNATSNTFENAISDAKSDLKRCLGGAIDTATNPIKKKCAKVRDAESKRDELLNELTPSHPSVIAANEAVVKAQRECDRTEAGVPTRQLSQSECIAAAKRRLEAVEDQQYAQAKKTGARPKLEKQWAELSLEVATLEAEYTTFQQNRSQVQRDRKSNANRFRDSFALVDPPRLPELPSYPDRNQFMFIGMGITLVIGMIIALLREAFRQTFVDSREVEEQTGLPVLSSLPSLSSKD